MASDIARHRAAKAARRKKLLHARRAATPVSLAQKVHFLATRPLHRCLIQPEMFKTGIGTVVLARRVENGQIAMAAFLVDAFSLGIKDLVFHMLEPSEFEAYIAMAHETAPFRAVDPSYARKLLRDAAAYAASLGLRPHRGFASIEPLFGDVRADDCTEEFSFGRGGKPFYMVGPTESTAQVMRRLERLAERLGPDGFDFTIPISEDEYLTIEADKAAQAPLAIPVANAP